MRHAYATLSLSAGIHPKFVSKALGHKSIYMMLDRYFHVVEGLQRSVAEVLDGEVGATTFPVRVITVSAIGRSDQNSLHGSQRLRRG